MSGKYLARRYISIVGSVPRVDLRAYRPPHAATKLLTKQYCERQRLVPIRVTQGVLIVALAHPEKRELATGEVALLTGLKVEVVHANLAEIENAIRSCYGAAS